MTEGAPVQSIGKSHVLRLDQAAWRVFRQTIDLVGAIRKQTMIRIIFPIVFFAVMLSSAACWAQAVALADDAPDTYTVVRGDTLWHIAGRFLREPWRWPEVWRLNQQQIRDPHRIYPGQVIMLDRSGPYLSIARRVGGDQRLSPQVYHEALSAAISSIPVRDIEPFISRTLVVDEATLAAAGTIIGNEGQRVFSGTGDRVFAKDVAAPRGTLEVFRAARPLTDPLSGEVLAHEAEYLGLARIVAAGTPAPAAAELTLPAGQWRHPSELEPGEVPWLPAGGGRERVRDGGVAATLEIVSAVEEIGSGDRLLAARDAQTVAYVPRAPEHHLEGRLIAVQRGVEFAGRHQVVTLNIGHHSGVEAGHVLALYRDRDDIVHGTGAGRERFELPQHRYGVVFVFRVFERVAYALVMDSDGPVRVGDVTRTP